MNQALIIDLQLHGLAQSAAGLRQIAALMKQINAMKAGAGGSGGGSGGGAARTPPNFAKRLQNLIFSTRIGANGQIMPLIGRLVGVLPPQLRLAVVAITALGAAAMGAANTIGAMRDAMNIGGGTMGNTNALAGIGAAVGMSPDEIANAGRSLKSSIGAGGAAAGFANQMGINAVPGPYGTLDTNQLELDFIKQLRKLPRDQALRTAQATGQEPMLKFRDLSDETFNRIIADAERLKNIYGPEQTAQAAEFAAAWGRVTKSAGDWLATGGAGLMKLFAFLFNKYADYTNWFVKLFGGASGDKTNKALDDHTQAMKDHTTALKNGTFGGGDRASGAIPGGLNGQNFSNWGSAARTFGAFG